MMKWFAVLIFVIAMIFTIVNLVDHYRTFGEVDLMTIGFMILMVAFLTIVFLTQKKGRG